MTIKVVRAPMSDRVPDSDYLMAQRLAKLQEDLHAARGSDWRIAGVKERIRLVFAEHDRQVEHFQNWLDEGKPDL